MLLSNVLETLMIDIENATAVTITNSVVILLSLYQLGLTKLIPINFVKTMK
jgi:hypothetical protein